MTRRKRPVVHLWLAKDPETMRVTAQAREWSDGDFPRGARGLGWPCREIDVDAAVWHALLAGETPPEGQDELHRQWWTDAAPEGTDPWPA